MLITNSQHDCISRGIANEKFKRQLNAKGPNISVVYFQLAKYQTFMSFDLILLGIIIVDWHSFSEIHRMCSITAFIPRVATQDYKVPGMQSFTIKKGQDVIIPMDCIHNDPKYYPDPETFNPERFSKEEIAKRPKGTFIPFGLGPRQCIGTFA